MKRKNKKSVIPIIFCCTGLIFILLLMTMIISNWIIIVAVDTGLIPGHPGTPLIPFLIHSGLISIFTGVVLTLTLGHFPLKPINQLIQAIHSVAGGNFQTKINLKRPKEFRELSESFNQMTNELAGIEILRSDFINNFSHEFKTPIVSIMGFARLLKSGNLNEQEKTEYLDIIISECRRLSDLSANILNLSKAESISVLKEKVTYNVTEQIRESILQLENKWVQKEITFDFHLNDCMVSGDRELLKQVWLNLIDNAVKFSHCGGTISIFTERNNAGFHFQISDQGIGMNTYTQSKIFDKFYQGDPSHSTEGSGLGLSLTAAIVSLHNGNIHVESEPGKGSKFTVTFK